MALTYCTDGCCSRDRTDGSYNRSTMRSRAGYNLSLDLKESRGAASATERLPSDSSLRIGSTSFLVSKWPSTRASEETDRPMGRRG